MKVTVVPVVATGFERRMSTDYPTGDVVVDVATAPDVVIVLVMKGCCSAWKLTVCETEPTVTVTEYKSRAIWSGRICASSVNVPVSVFSLKARFAQLEAPAPQDIEVGAFARLEENETVPDWALTLPAGKPLATRLDFKVKYCRISWCSVGVRGCPCNSVPQSEFGTQSRADCQASIPLIAKGIANLNHVAARSNCCRDVKNEHC